MGNGRLGQVKMRRQLFDILWFFPQIPDYSHSRIFSD